MSAVVLLALMVGVLIAVLPSGQRGTPAGGGVPFEASAVTATPRVGAGEYAYRVTEYYRVSADGTVQQGGGENWSEPDRQQVWAAPDGEQWVLDSTNGTTQCSLRAADAGTVAFDQPTQSFFDQMPTGVQGVV